ncbi:MAG: cyclase family protein [Acidimicrobiales bacterium]
MSTDEVRSLHDRLSNWGRWGPDDQLGTLNFITAEVTAAAASAVLSGQTVSCARPLPTQPAPDNPTPVVHHMIGTATEGYGADYFALAPHGFATSHIDALCHIFHQGKLYNGYDTETVTAHGAAQLGIHHLRSGIITRGVLVDVPAIRGVEALEPGEPIFPEDLESAERTTGVTVQSGDALMVRTGRWRWREAHGPSWPPSDGLAGLDASCLS